MIIFMMMMMMMITTVTMMTMTMASCRCLALEEVVNMASESTFSFAKAICSVPEVIHVILKMIKMIIFQVRLSDVRLSNDLWEIVAKRLRQRESRLLRWFFQIGSASTRFE